MFDAKDNKKVHAFTNFIIKYCAAGKSSGGALYFFHILLQWGRKRSALGERT